MAGPYPSETETAYSPFSTRNTVLEGVEAKKHIVSELIEGRLCLLEAVAQFEAVHRTSTLDLEHSLGVPVSQDGESICRSVIGWIPIVMGDRPEQANMVIEKLEGELDTLLARHGKVLLPSLN